MDIDTEIKHLETVIDKLAKTIERRSSDEAEEIELAGEVSKRKVKYTPLGELIKQRELVKKQLQQLQLKKKGKHRAKTVFKF